MTRRVTCDDLGDDQLVARVLGGQSDAFTALYRRHLPAVRHTISSNVTGADAAADVIQDVFLRAAQGVGRLEDPTRFRPWLLAIARHTAIDHRRRRRRDLSSPTDHAALERPDPTRSVDEGAVASEVRRVIAGGLARLAPRDATALSLELHLGLRPSEIAPVLDITQGAAKVLIHRARRKLRVALAIELAATGQAYGCPDLDREAGAAAARGHVSGCAACTASGDAWLHHYLSTTGS